MLQVNLSLKRTVSKSPTGVTGCSGTENTRTHQVLLLFVKNTVGSTEMSVCSLVSPFPPEFCFSFPLLFPQRASLPHQLICIPLQLVLESLSWRQHFQSEESGSEREMAKMSAGAAPGSLFGPSFLFWVLKDGRHCPVTLAPAASTGSKCKAPGGSWAPPPPPRNRIIQTLIRRPFSLVLRNPLALFSGPFR